MNRWKELAEKAQSAGWEAGSNTMYDVEASPWPLRRLLGVIRAASGRLWENCHAVRTAASAVERIRLLSFLTIVVRNTLPKLEEAQAKEIARAPGVEETWQIEASKPSMKRRPDTEREKQLRRSVLAWAARWHRVRAIQAQAEWMSMHIEVGRHKKGTSSRAHWEKSERLMLVRRESVAAIVEDFRRRSQRKDG